jgi:hypothetical protein
LSGNTIIVILVVVGLVGSAAFMGIVFLILRALGGSSKGQASPVTSTSRRDAPPLREIGRTDALCPTCNVKLKKKPGGKTRCRSCGNFIWVRKRPIDDQKVSLNEAQLEDYEEQKAIADGRYDEYLDSKQTKERLRANFVAKNGCEPTKEKLQLLILDHDAEQARRARNWPRVKDAYEAKMHIFHELGELDNALFYSCQVVYILVNGPYNPNGGDTSWCPSDDNDYMINWFTRDECAQIAYEIGLAGNQVKTRFLNAAVKIAAVFGCPLSPERAWAKVGKLILNGFEDARQTAVEEDEDEE